MWQNTPNNVKRKTSFLLGLMLMLSVLAATHMMDIDPEHHTSHHCELFSLNQFITSHSLPQVPEFHSEFTAIITESVTSLQRLYFAYLARSPPAKIT
ncbi:hypothetical protein A3712_11760 [Vibrio sp. HI00D65]|uniref:DUF2607 domain-containing protein n=1 Tax=Vibrio sp. HI00D65 TaxID=1822216 RepID=UPI0007B7E6B7|nr:DUF2607 domain-containing protein [Vibrio sp. HI00D65]KZX69458.1 hypothetical protein A3712_11760 [Vibrio sp. HI00D65]|tara:strand:- start:4806 stop:5096 length:291 start_codon:yes stop_codon:yes gene_type:complete